MNTVNATQFFHQMNIAQQKNHDMLFEIGRLKDVVVIQDSVMTKTPEAQVKVNEIVNKYMGVSDE